MPTVAIIDGVKIQFYAREHAPPHFHAIYAEHRAQIAIGSLQVLKGGLPPAKLAIVLSWAEPRQQALMRAWDATIAQQKPEKIA